MKVRELGGMMMMERKCRVIRETCLHGRIIRMNDVVCVWCDVDVTFYLEIKCARMELKCFFLRELEFIAHADVQQKKYVFILLKNKSVPTQLTCQIPSLVCVIFSIDNTFLSFWGSAVVWGGVCSITYSLNITDDPRRRDVGGLNKLELAEFWWMKWNRNFQSLLKWSEAFGCE